MKKNFALIMLAGAVLFTSCGSNAVEATDPEKKAEATVESITYKVDGSQSELQWAGKKLASGHTGLITIKSGELSAEGEKITAGKFEVDMKTITETGNDDAEKAEMLVGHLMSPEFFDAEQFPLTTFEITDVKGEKGSYDISGNLTIKGVSKNITFPASVKLDGDKLTATAEFTINRNDWGVTYGSGLSGAAKDQAIHDDIEFKVSLVATK